MKPKGYGSDVKKCGYEMGVKPRSGGPEKVKPKGDGPDIKKIGNATKVTSTPHLNGVHRQTQGQRGDLHSTFEWGKWGAQVNTRKMRSLTSV